MNNQLLEKYANLIIKVGVNLQKGQCLIIKGEHTHWEFVNLLQQVAYKNGAKYIHTDLQAPFSKLNQNKFQHEEFLNFIPKFIDSQIAEYVEDRWSIIHLDGKADPNCFESLNQEKNAIIEKVIREHGKRFSCAALSGKCCWTIAPLPTPGWAQKVLGGKASEENKNALWEILIPILKLDKSDPVKAWQDHSDRLKERISILDQSDIDYLHFTGPGTDLKIYLSQYSRWQGGAFTSPEGNPFMPNIPTEEIFSTPDFRKTEGRIKVTKPVNVLGKDVVDAYFEFKNGQVNKFSASIGEDTLAKYFEIDPTAKYLGEVALVDTSSPIYMADKIFHSILLDENASCHIALGRGISTAIIGGDKMSEEELKNVGHNNSLLHTDFMVGSSEVSVTGVLHDGQKLRIISNGLFNI